jgi:predicted O-linked N-acetylglucosamine transferase (SPINDLY family)
MHTALRRHQAGHLADAEALYRRILSHEPNHPEALHLLGVLASQTNRPEIAAELLGRAVAIRPRVAEYQSNLGNALRLIGRFDEAAAACRCAIELKPDFAEAHNNLGNALLDLGLLDAAVAAYREAAQIDSASPRLHYHLGNALSHGGRFDEAITAYREAVRLDRDCADAWNGVGNALRERGKLEDAVAACRRATELRPDFAEAWNNLANALADLGKLDDAICASQKAIHLRPKFAEAQSNLGVSLCEKGRLDEAIAAHRRAVEIAPGFAKGHSNLGDALVAEGRIDEALAAYEKAMVLRPEDPAIASHRLYTLHYHPAYDARALFQEHRQWNECHARPFERFTRPHKNDLSPERRLRIGFVSPDFREHVVGRQLLSLFRALHTTDLEIHAYANVARPDRVTEELRALAHGWRNIFGLSAEDAAELIRADAIDILVDLALHTDGNRLSLFARKPAPVQVTWLGYCSTSGLDAMDYRFSDAQLDPPGTDLSCYSEETVYLPRTYWCYETAVPTPEVTPLPAAASGHLTFGCLNNFAKVSGPTLELWMEILGSVPKSHLLLHAPAGSARQSVLERFERHGIAPERVEFVARQSWEQYLRTLQRIDVALDPFPYGGGISTCDALWMGVPVVTLSGHTAVGRSGRSILSTIGLPELIAQTPLQYLEIARALANDLPRLSQLRATLCERLEQSPLRDAPAQARDMEAAYRGMWYAWCGRGKEAH